VQGSSGRGYPIGEDWVIKAGELGILLGSEDASLLPSPPPPASLQGGVVQLPLGGEEFLQASSLAGGGLKEQNTASVHSHSLAGACDRQSQPRREGSVCRPARPSRQSTHDPASQSAHSASSRDLESLWCKALWDA
jgi:hypothetical protein